MRLQVDCIEAGLTDLGAAWSTSRKPEHAGVEALALWAVDIGTS